MIITGYPRTTTDAELDRMIEAECERAWDEQQITITPIAQLTQEQRIDADASARLADDNFRRGLDWLATTAERVPGTPDADRLNSIYDQISDLVHEMRQIKKGWGV